MQLVSERKVIANRRLIGKGSGTSTVGRDDRFYSLLWVACYMITRLAAGSSSTVPLDK